MIISDSELIQCLTQFEKMQEIDSIGNLEYHVDYSSKWQESQDVMPRYEVMDLHASLLTSDNQADYMTIEQSQATLEILADIANSSFMFESLIFRIDNF